VGETINAKECTAFISQIKECLSSCVQQVLLRADGEFLSRQSVKAALGAGFGIIFANNCRSSGTLEKNFNRT
jgi:hypothetical protein